MDDRLPMIANDIIAHSTIPFEDAPWWWLPQAPSKTMVKHRNLRLWKTACQCNSASENFRFLDFFLRVLRLSTTLILQHLCWRNDFTLIYIGGSRGKGGCTCSCIVKSTPRFAKTCSLVQLSPAKMFYNTYSELCKVREKYAIVQHLIHLLFGERTPWNDTRNLFLTQLDHLSLPTSYHHAPCRCDRGGRLGRSSKQITMITCWIRGTEALNPIIRRIGVQTWRIGTGNR